MITETCPGGKSNATASIVSRCSKPERRGITLGQAPRRPAPTEFRRPLPTSADLRYRPRPRKIRRIASAGRTSPRARSPESGQQPRPAAASAAGDSAPPSPPGQQARPPAPGLLDPNNAPRSSGPGSPPVFPCDRAIATSCPRPRTYASIVRHHRDISQIPLGIEPRRHRTRLKECGVNFITMCSWCVTQITNPWSPDRRLSSNRPRRGTKSRGRTWHDRRNDGTRHC
jgi:hypothetical protein